MRITRIALAVSIAVLALGLSSASAQVKDAAVDKLVADWSTAFGKGDVKTLASLYTENAVRISPEGGRVVGRDAIAKEFATNFAGPWKGAQIKISVGAFQAVAPDVAVGEGTYEVMATGPDGKPHVGQGQLRQHHGQEERRVGAGEQCRRPAGRTAAEVDGHRGGAPQKRRDRPLVPAQSSSVSTRCARTSSSRGDHAKTVKRPSWEATSASASCWSWANCAAEMWRVPPSWSGDPMLGRPPSTGSVTSTRSTRSRPSGRPIFTPKARSS